MSGLEQFRAAAHAWLNDEMDDGAYADQLRSMLGRGYVPFPVADDAAPEPVLVRFDRVYGLVKCYPANAQAEVLAKIAGTKTLSPATLAGARALGLRVECGREDPATLSQFLAGVAL